MKQRNQSAKRDHPYDVFDPPDSPVVKRPKVRRQYRATQQPSIDRDEARSPKPTPAKPTATPSKVDGENAGLIKTAAPIGDGEPSPGPGLYIEERFNVKVGDWMIRRADSDKLDGPFRVAAIRGQGSDYEVQLRFPPASKADPWTRVHRLIPVHPLPDLHWRGVYHVEGEKHESVYVDLIPYRPLKSGLFDVGKLIDRRPIDTEGFQYLVRWKWFPTEDDTWEPESVLPPGLVAEYNKIHPLE